MLALLLLPAALRADSQGGSYARARAEELAGNFAKAAPLYDAARTESPTSCIAILSQQITRLATAASLATSAGLLLDLADLYRNRASEGDGRRARARYEQALKLQPKSAPASFYLGSVCLEEGDFDAALEALDSAARLVSADFYYRTVVAEARARAAARSPACTEGVRLALAASRLDQGHVAEAKKQADERVKASQGIDRLHWLRLKLRADPAAQAETDWEKSGRMFEVGNYEVALQSAELARQSYEKAGLELRVKDCLMRRSYCLEMLGPSRRAEALEAYAKAADYTATHAFRESRGYILWRLALLLYQDGKPAQARPKLEESLELARQTRSGEGGPAAMWLGTIECEAGEAARAERRFAESVTAAERGCRPDELAAALHARAECLRQAGRLPEAIDQLRAVCALDRQLQALNRSELDSRVDLAELLIAAATTEGLQEAGRVLESVLADARRIEDVAHRAKALLLQGWRSWEADHDLKAFESRVDEAAGLAGGPDVRLPKALARARLQLAQAYELRGDYDRGVRQLELASSVADAGPREKLQATLELARCLIRRSGPGDLDKAETALCASFGLLSIADGKPQPCHFSDADDLAAVLAPRDGMERLRLDFTQGRAELAYARGAVGGAIQLTASTTAALASLPGGILRAPVLAKLAVFLLEGGRALDAERVASDALDRAGAEGTIDTFGYLAARGLSRGQLGKTTDAVRDLDDAAFQLKQYLLAVVPGGTGVMESWNSYQQLYDTLISILLASKQPRRAFELVQEKNLLLVRQGELYRPFGTGDPAVDAYAAGYRALKERWKTLETALSALGENDPGRAQKLEQLHLVRQQAFEHLSRANAQEGLRNAVVTPDTLDHLQSLLPRDTDPFRTRVVQYAFLTRAPQPALVTFLIGPERDDVESISLTLPGAGSAKTPEELVRSLTRDLVGKICAAPAAADRAWRVEAGKLGDAVLAPILASLTARRVKRVMIAPDGPLYSVPF
ncbi:MAG: tetratricopeptide repeat protein [Candidatus Wallbacteria bacterium]|nr:tetratricopeptide repeat protein [Candidatus Wallbacteria bacterium]